MEDNLTPQAGAMPSTGISYVLVNGTVVVKDSKVLKGAYPGKPVRTPVIINMTARFTRTCFAPDRKNQIEISAFQPLNTTK